MNLSLNLLQKTVN